MKRKINKMFYLVIIILFASNIYAQDGEQKISAEQKAWMEAMSPGENHKLLEKHIGSWNTVAKFWMAPDAEPEINKGTADNKMIMDGRYLKSDYSATAWGQPMVGISTQGYDNTKKKFIGTWIDNMGTGISYNEGVYNKSKNAIISYGSMLDPITGNDKKYRNEIHFTSKDKHVLKMFTDFNGKEFLTMEIVYTRK